MMFNVKKSVCATAVAVVAMVPSLTAQAAATITFGEDKYVSVGFGSIAAFNSVENGAGNGGRSRDFSLDHARIYMSGSLNKYIKGMFNTERTGGSPNGGDSTVEVIDAVGIFQITPEFSIWAGRHLSPSDRANMAGPFYAQGVGYWQNIASRYGWNGGVIGRDDGVTGVLELMDSHLNIAFGAYDGDKIFRFSGINAQSSKCGACAERPSDKLMYAGRVQMSFWDAEPGYYGTGNYYGAKDILTVGLAARYKSDGAVSLTEKGNYRMWSADFLLEKKDFGPGTVSLEAAYYDYDTDKVFLGEEGKAYSAGAAYLFNQTVGWGRFQPFLRYQRFDADGVTDGTGANVSTAGFDTKRSEIGVNYVIEPYNAMISAVYSKTKVTGASSNDGLQVALQLQF